VLLTELEGDYHRALIDGVCRKADSLGVDLVFYPGHMPGTPVPFERQFGVVFDMVDAQRLDGLLIFASSMQFHLDDGGMRRFLDGFAPLPAVLIIGNELPGHPAVVLDNHAGFRQLVPHFIAVHGHRRIAMIEGPATTVTRRSA
jgi:DNA-binding LacI/PurR family transcriptional regulator